MLIRFVYGKRFRLKDGFKAWKKWIHWFIDMKPYNLKDSDWKSLRDDGIAFIAGHDRMSHPIAYFMCGNLDPSK